MRNDLIFILFIWSRWPGSNRRPRAPKARNLPTDLHLENMAANPPNAGTYHKKLANFCRGGRARTDDLLVPNQARYQLRYTPFCSLSHCHSSRPTVTGIEPVPIPLMGSDLPFVHSGSVDSVTLRGIEPLSPGPKPDVLCLRSFILQGNVVESTPRIELGSPPYQGGILCLLNYADW